MTIPPPPPGRFDDDEPIDDEDAPSIVTRGKRKSKAPPEPVRLSDKRWRIGLLANSAGKYKNLEHNIAQILNLHPLWHGVIAYDRFASKLYAMKRPPFAQASENTNAYPRPWTDWDTGATMTWFQRTEGVLIDATKSATDTAIDQVGQLNAFNPLHDYLRSLKWDCEQRLPKLLASYFGAEPSDYASAVGTAWLISAIARAMRPGCQADYMLVLEGNQGARKSSALRELFSDAWFTDARISLNDEGLKKLRGKWCVEIAELESFRGKAATEIKAFITSRVDHYRDSYGRRPQDYPRTCVMAGTTNEREYLVDRTGNRRFWPITCGDINIHAIKRDRDQLWAEAYARFESGEQWWLDNETGAREEQRKRELREPWYEIIAAWLENPTIPDQNGRVRLNKNDGFSMAEVMLGALNLRSSEMQRDALARVGFCMTKLQYERRWSRKAGRKERRYFHSSMFVTYENGKEIPHNQDIGR